MISAHEIIQKYISYFEKKGHTKIPNSPLIPQNDPTTLFTSSGMQPLVPYLLGEPHPGGNRLVNVQNSFRAQDIDEIGDNRHTTFFRMLGNWSLGDYFKKEQIPWIFEFITKELGINPQKIYVSVFDGLGDIPKDTESADIWKELFTKEGIDYKDRIHYYSSAKNWWSRAGLPENMPVGEPGGPDTEIFYDFGADERSDGARLLDRGGGGIHENSRYKNHPCHMNCDCGRFFEISNSVFMQYKKENDGSFKPLKQKNVDHGAGLERFLAAAQNKSDVFETSLFAPIIKLIEKTTGKKYQEHSHEMRIITDHFTAASFIAKDGVTPANKDQGYILRRLIRRGLDNLYQLQGKDIVPVLEVITQQYSQTDKDLVAAFENVKNSILEEQQKYDTMLHGAKKYIEKKYGSISSPQAGSKVGDELLGQIEISADDAFVLYTTHGLSPTQIKSLGYIFDDQAFATKMEDHQKLSREGAKQKFAGGLADHSEKTIMGHTATHLMHQALRDVLGDQVHQTGSNIATERLRFDFNYDQKLTDEQITEVEDVVNKKIADNLPVSFEMIPTEQAKKIGAIGLFGDTYAETSKIYFIGGSSQNRKQAYSVEFCGGPHVDFTGRLKRFKIIKQENIGHGQRRIYAEAGD